MSYLTQSAIADDPWMQLRVAACAAQQGCTDVGIDPDVWAHEWRRVWSASPGWDAQWESALARADNPPGYQPGMDPAVVSDGQVLSQVQAQMPFTRVVEGGSLSPGKSYPRARADVLINVNFTFDADSIEEAQDVVSTWTVTPNARLTGLAAMVQVVEHPVAVTMGGAVGGALREATQRGARSVIPAPGGPPAVNPDYDERGGYRG